MQDFSNIFGEIPDPRRSNATRHDLHEMLTIALLCIIAGGETCTDMSDYGRIKESFLRRFMTLKHGIPSHDAFSDLAGSIDPEALHAVLLRLARSWAQHLEAESPDDIIATGGKALRRSFACASARQPLHLVHAFATDVKLVLAQVAVDRKPNEITAIPALLEMLDIRGKTVTADVMHTQRSTAGTVTARGGDYILALKGNQETFHDDVRLHMADPENAENIRLSREHVEKGHGRIEIRQSAICHDVDRLQDLPRWPGLQAVGKITATREIKGKQSTETRYFLMSRKLDPERFLRGVRAHWREENSLHWILDVTMNEDNLRNRTGPGPEKLAVMRRLALNLARVKPDKLAKSMRRRLKQDGWDDRFTLELFRSAGLLPENGRI